MTNLSKNLKFLLKKFSINPSELARRTGIKQPVIHRLVTGESANPQITTLCPLADFFSLRLDQLIGREPLPINFMQNKTWEKLHTANNSIPLLKSHQVLCWLKTKPKKTRGEKFYTNLPKGSKSFAIRVEDNSMRPYFTQGAILVIDLNLSYKNEDLVLVRIKGYKKIIFKQLFITSTEKYLKPLNPQFRTMLLDKPHEIIGVVSQIHCKF